MSYDEHLISQAGGDGDVLDQIQRRADATKKHHSAGNSFPLDADKDRDYLLALVREQQEQIERVMHVAETFDSKPGHRWAAANLRAALEPKP